MATYVRIVSALSRLAGLVAIALLVAAVLVVTHMVVMRYFLNASTIWQTDFVTYAIVAATFLGAPYVLLEKGHVNVDLLPNALPPGPRRAMNVAAAFMGLVFAALLTWSGWIYFQEAWERGWRTETVWAIPLWIPLLPLPLGIGLLCLQYIAEMWKEARGEPAAPPGHMPYVEERP